MPEPQALTAIAAAAETRAALPEEVRLILSAAFLDETACRRWFIDRYYPDGPACPICGAAVTSERSLQTFRALRRFTCSACGRQPRPTKGTVLQDCPLTPREVFLLAALCGLGVDQTETARILGIAVETVRAWRGKFASLAEVGL